MSDTETLLRQVEEATCAEDLFGLRSTDPAAVRRARRTQRVLALALHPDRGAEGVDPARAAAAFTRVTQLYAEWSAPAARPARDVLVGSRGTYGLGELVGTGSVANVYAVPGSDVVVKLARRPGSARFLRNERWALTVLGETTQRRMGWLAPYVPRLVDTATAVADDAAEPREANVLGSLSRAEGFVSLAEVRAAYPDGLDGRDWAWMQRRLIRALAGAHEAGLVHGALLAENVLVHPHDHGVVLAGWSFATRPGRPAEGRVASSTTSYPPEVGVGPVTPATDVAMLGALGLTMLRRDEQAQRRFAQGCMQHAPAMRPRAADLTAEYDDLLERLYGPRRFRPFAMAV